MSVQGDWHTLANGEAAFEDGTVNYLALPAVEQGLRYLDGIGIDTIHTRVRCLTDWLLDELATLRHANGSPVVQVHGPQTTYRRGGRSRSTSCVRKGASWTSGPSTRAPPTHGVSLRTGCFCNPGAAELAFGVRSRGTASAT